MSVSGISTSSLYQTPGVQNDFQKARQEFQQLGQDLESGNLSAAQSDFATLQNLLPQSASTTTAAQSNNPIAQAFAQLGKDLAVRQFVRGAIGFRHDSTGFQESSVARRASVRRTSSSPRWRIERDQPALRSTRPGASIGQSFFRAANFRCADATVAATLSDNWIIFRHDAHYH